MEKMKSIFILLLGTMIASCAIHRQQTKNADLEPLKIAEIKEKINDLSRTKNHPNHEIRSSEKVINFLGPSGINENFTYQEEDLKSGLQSRISGDKKYGYSKEIIDPLNPVIKVTDYYINGKVKAKRTVHSEMHLITNSNRVEFPVAKSYSYDQQGQVVSITDHDSIFKFSFDDLVRLLRKKDPNVKITEAIGTEYHDNSAIWTVKYLTTKDELCSMKINANTGAVLYDFHHLTTTE